LITHGTLKEFAIGKAFANTYGIRTPGHFTDPRVGNPGLEFANAFGVIS